MSDESLEPLADDLRALLEIEKADYAFSPAFKAEVLGHVELAVGLSGTTAAAAGTAVATVSVGLKTAAAIGFAGLLLGGGIGASAVAITTRTVPQAVIVPHESAAVRDPAAVIAATASAISAQELAPALIPGTTQVATTAIATATTVATVQFRDLSKEREILDVARAALGRGRPNDAITAAQEHAQKWPRGYLVEEREVVLIQALAAAGRKPEAERKATQFRKFFPKSMLLPAVSAATAP
jgi:hypothetical protein